MQLNWRNPQIWISLFILVVVAAVSIWFTGSLEGSKDFLNGHRVTLDTKDCACGLEVEAELIEVTLPVRNISFSEVKLLGIEAECRCFSILSDFPVTIDRFSSCSVRLAFKPPTKSGDIFSKHFFLIGDREGEKYHFRIHGQIK